MARPRKIPTSAVRKNPPVVKVPHRKVRDAIRQLLFVRAGGRCQFDGCNRYLFEHSLTLIAGNFSQVAHIVAFSKRGPRGEDTKRPSDINDVDNLMLMCPDDHTLVDRNPGRFSAEGLRAHKHSHEKRIKHLTSLGPNRKTAVVVFRALIANHTVSVPYDHIFTAVGPRYPSTTEPYQIDLTGLRGTDRQIYAAACSTIKQRIHALFEPEGLASKAGHVSVFALGPIPLLICLGRELTSTVPVDVYQRHRDTEDWTWKRSGQLAQYEIRRVHEGKPGHVALIVSLSGRIRVTDLPVATQKEATLYELTLRGQDPSPTFLRRRQDVEGFRVAYQRMLAKICGEHTALASIDLFPALPAPLAVLCGRELLPKVHPRLRVFDNDQNKGGFTFKLKV